MKVDTIYSNLDHQFTPGAIDFLKSNPGVELQHSAWEFCGSVKYDETSGMFVELVKRFHAVVAEYQNKDIEALIEEVNKNHGYE